MVETQSASPDFKPDPDLSGRRLGDYQLMRRLARGGMADVYLANQQSLRRQVAFKVLRSNLARDETYVRRFHNEAQAAAALVQANIVQIYEVGCIEGIHFIAQEYVPGHNLKQLLVRRGPLKLKKAVHVMRQVAAALQRASSRGIIHRDIKPENIMLSPSSEVKVADFGLARVTGEGGQLNLTQVGVTLGTPLYMSPEQVEGRELDPRSDLYSFGVTCYEMLSGKPPFSGDTALSVAVQHLKNDPPRLEDVRPDLPGGLCRIVHKMLAKKPAHRYQNAAELLKDLRALQVEGLNDDWTPEADSADASQLATLAEARNAATQQLDIVMKEESLVFRRGLRGWWFGLAVAVAFAVGAAMAGVLRPASLLDVDSDEKPGVERKATAEAQFRYAFDVGTEAAFAAVEQYFPPALSTENELYVNKAKLQLAYLYRESDRLEEAISILRDLVSQGSDTALQASAHVELANIHVRRGEMVDAQKSLLQLPGLLKQMNRLSPRDQQEWGQLVPAVLRRDFELALQSQVEGSQGRSPGPKKGAVEK